MPIPGRVRLFSAFTLLSAGLLSVGCDGLLPAVGSYENIYVVTERPLDEETIQALRGELEIEFETVQLETLFTILPIRADTVKAIENRKNFLMVIDLSTDDLLRKEARYLLGKSEVNRVEQSATAELFFISDAWAKYQAHALLLVPRKEFFTAAVAKHGRTIREGFLQLNRKRILSYLLFQGEKASLSRRLYKNFGWWMTIPADFFPKLDYIEEQFFSMKTDRPAKLFFVYWRDGVDVLPSGEELAALRDTLTWKYYDEDFAEPSRMKITKSVFRDRETVRLQGLWQNEKYTIGGPFRSLIFLDQENRRLYFLDYAVYAPNFPKKYYLWELESILETFSLSPPPGEESGRS